MSASEIGVEESLPQKRFHKNNRNCTGTSEKTYCSGATKKVLRRNTQLLIAEW